VIRRREFILTLATGIALSISSQVAAEDQAVCHRVVEKFNWVDGKVFEGCRPGDVLIAQLNNVAPAAIVARHCDLRFSIFNDKRSDTDHTVVCRLRETVPLPMRPLPK
jgi:hypothetical protein